MPSELKDLLERAADRPSGEPDFAALARTGRRRRYTQRAASALAVVAVIALTSTVVLPKLNPPQVAFDTAPRGGVGEWDAVPPAPIEMRADALAATDGRRVAVFGGTALEDPGGDVPLYDGAIYDTKARSWTAIKPLPIDDELPEDHWFPDHLELLDDGRLLVVFEAPVIVAFYDFESQTWEKQGAQINGVDVTFAAWTGSQVILLGPTADRGTQALVYTDGVGWKAARRGPLSARMWATTAWTGEKLLVWGGVDWARLENGEQERVFDDGAAYDPVTDTWEMLPASPLSARQSAESLWTGKEWIIMGGSGASKMTQPDETPSEAQLEVTEECNAFSCSGTASAGGAAEPMREGRYFLDGARYNPSTGEWSTVAALPKGAREWVALGGETFEAQGNNAWAVYDAAANTWDVRGQLPNPYDFDATVYVGDQAIQVNTTRDTHMAATNSPRRIGGQIYNERAERWDPLAEADAAQRWGAAVTPVGDNRYFVWGGVSAAREITVGDSGGGMWKYHDDGALLTIE